MDLFSLVAKLTLDKNDFDKDLDQAERELGAIDVPDPKLELDNDEFNGALEESQGLGETFGTEMEGVFKGIKTALTVTGIAGLIAGIVNGLKEAINMTAETADGIDKGSKMLGISTTKYQAWDHALRQSGAGINDVRKGIINFQTALKAADPSTPFADAEDQVDGLADKTAGLSADAYEGLKSLGMLDKLIAGQYSSAEEMMEDALLRLADFDGSAEERGIIVRQLFGRGGDVLNALLDEGKAGVQELLGEAEKYGLIMSDDEINQAVEYGDAVQNLNAELDAIKQAFVKDIIPLLTDATKWLTDFLAGLNPRLSTQNIFTIFDEIDRRTMVASMQIDEATITAKKLIEDLKEMGDYWTLDDEGKMTWDALADKALELFPQLSDYIDRDGKKIRGNTDEIEANIDAWARLEKQRLLSNAMAEKQEAVAAQLTKAYEKGAEARLKEDEAEAKRLLAIKKLNDELKAAGMEQLALDASEEESSKAMSDLLDYYSDDESAQLRIGLIYKEYGEVRMEAAKLRAEAESLKEDALKAQESLATEQQYLMEEMGMTEKAVEEEKKSITDLIETMNKIPDKVSTEFEFINPWKNPENDNGYPSSYAIGSHYIPYDQMALLHRGERVLTATENRQDNGSGFDFGHMEDVVAAAIRNGMDGVTVRSFLNGRDVTDEVNRINMQGIKGRRFSV